ncbi:sensor histidine kinase [Streptomyces sp. NPDC002643]
MPILADIPDDRLSEHLERTAYFIITEALSNVYKHAEATRVQVRVELRPAETPHTAGTAESPDNTGTPHRSAAGPPLLLIRVTDDGTGGADPTRGTGLRGLEDRVGALGGRLRVHSPRGTGTQLLAELPCGS